MSPVKERILVVSDGEGFRMVICSLLSSVGYQCREAASPKKALATLNSGEEVGVVLWNLWESCEVQIVERAIETFPDTLVVAIVSGGLHLSEFGEALRKRAYAYLIETIEREQLLTIVRRGFAATLAKQAG